MTRVNSAAMHNVCELTRVPSLPFLFRSTEHLHTVLDGEIGEQLLRGCEKAGFVGLPGMTAARVPSIPAASWSRRRQTPRA